MDDDTRSIRSGRSVASSVERLKVPAVIAAKSKEELQQTVLDLLKKLKLKDRRIEELSTNDQQTDSTTQGLELKQAQDRAEAAEQQLAVMASASKQGALAHEEQLQRLRQELADAAAALASAQSAANERREQDDMASQQAASLKAALKDMSSEKQAAFERLGQAKGQISELKAEVVTLKQQLAEAEAQLAKQQQAERGAHEREQTQVDMLTEQLKVRDSALDLRDAQLTSLKAQLHDLTEQLAQQAAKLSVEEAKHSQASAEAASLAELARAQLVDTHAAAISELNTSLGLRLEDAQRLHARTLEEHVASALAEAQLAWQSGLDQDVSAGVAKAVSAARTQWEAELETKLDEQASRMKEWEAAGQVQLEAAASKAAALSTHIVELQKQLEQVTELEASAAAAKEAAQQLQMQMQGRDQEIADLKGQLLAAVQSGSGAGCKLESSKGDQGSGLEAAMQKVMAAAAAMEQCVQEADAAPAIPAIQALCAELLDLVETGSTQHPIDPTGGNARVAEPGHDGLAEHALKLAEKDRVIASLQRELEGLRAACSAGSDRLPAQAAGGGYAEAATPCNGLLSVDADVSAQLEPLKQEVRHLQDKLLEKEAELAELQEKLLEKEAELAEVQEKLQAVSDALAACQYDLRGARAVGESAQCRVSALEQSVQEAMEQVEAAGQDKASLESRLSGLQAEYDDVNRQARELEALSAASAADGADAQGHISALKLECARLERSVATLTRQSEAAADEAAAASRAAELRLHAADEELSLARQGAANLHKQVACLQAELAQAQAAAATALADAAAAMSSSQAREEEESAQLKAELVEVQAALQQALREAQAAEAARLGLKSELERSAWRAEELSADLEVAQAEIGTQRAAAASATAATAAAQADAAALASEASAIRVVLQEVSAAMELALRTLSLPGEASPDADAAPVGCADAAQLQRLTSTLVTRAEESLAELERSRAETAEVKKKLLALAKKTKSEAGATAKDLTARCAALEAQVAELEPLRSQLLATRAAAAEASAVAEAAKAQLRADAQQTQSALQKERDAAGAALAEAKAALAAAHAAAAQQASRVDAEARRLEADVKRVQLEKEQAVSRVERQLQAKEEELERLRHQLTSAEAEAEAMKGELSASRASLTAATQGAGTELAAARAEVDTLRKELESERTKSARALEESRKRFSRAQKAQHAAEVALAESRGKAQAEAAGVRVEVALLTQQVEGLRKDKDHLEQELAAYKARAQALLRAKDAEIAKAKEVGAEALQDHHQLAELRQAVDAAASARAAAEQALEQQVAAAAEELAAAVESAEGQAAQLRSSVEYYKGISQAAQKAVEEARHRADMLEARLAHHQAQQEALLGMLRGVGPLAAANGSSAGGGRGATSAAPTATSESGNGLDAWADGIQQLKGKVKDLEAKLASVCEEYDMHRASCEALLEAKDAEVLALVRKNATLLEEVAALRHVQAADPPVGGAEGSSARPRHRTPPGLSPSQPAEPQPARPAHQAQPSQQPQWDDKEGEWDDSDFVLDHADGDPYPPPSTPRASVLARPKAAAADQAAPQDASGILGSLLGRTDDGAHEGDSAAGLAASHPGHQAVPDQAASDEEGGPSGLLEWMLSSSSDVPHSAGAGGRRAHGESVRQRHGSAQHPAEDARESSGGGYGHLHTAGNAQRSQEQGRRPLSRVESSASSSQQQLAAMSEREAAFHAEVRSLRQRIHGLEAEVRDLEREVSLRDEMERALKESMRDMERAMQRQAKGASVIDAEYLKNTVMKLYRTGEAEALLPVFGIILSLSKEEMVLCRKGLDALRAGDVPMPGAAAAVDVTVNSAASLVNSLSSWTSWAMGAPPPNPPPTSKQG